MNTCTQNGKLENSVLFKISILWRNTHAVVLRVTAVWCRVILPKSFRIISLSPPDLSYDVYPGEAILRVK